MQLKEGMPVATPDCDRFGTIVLVEGSYLIIRWGDENSEDVRVYHRDQFDAYEFLTPCGVILRAIKAYAKMRGYTVANGCRLADEVIEMLERNCVTENRT